jgi:hypothetical protein
MSNITKHFLLSKGEEKLDLAGKVMQSLGIDLSIPCEYMFVEYTVLHICDHTSINLVHTQT